MKKILTSALAIVLFVGASQAQTTEPAKDHHRGQGKEWMKDLNLTDAQKTQLKTLHEAEKKEMDAQKSAGSVSADQRKAIREKYRSQFEAVLTPAQREEMKQKMQGRKQDGADRGNRGFDRNEGGRLSPLMNKELNLTADQQTKLKAYSDDFRAKAQGVRANSSLTEDQKKVQMRDLSKQFMEQSKGVLTAEQLQKAKELRGNRKNHIDKNS